MLRIKKMWLLVKMVTDWNKSVPWDQEKVQKVQKLFVLPPLRQRPENNFDLGDTVDHHQKVSLERDGHFKTEKQKAVSEVKNSLDTLKAGWKE